MLQPDEARTIILAKAHRLGSEPVQLRDAFGRVLADEVVATENIPPFAASTMDGYAVIADDPSPWREIVGHQTAGYVEDLELHLGTAAWITTGSPLPTGADAVVPVEATELSDGHVIIVDHVVVQGDNIRPVGVDLAVGTVVLESGIRLGPAEIGLLAGLGIDPPQVTRRPRVSILSTGNELVEPGESPRPGQIRDSNRFSLIAAALEAGAEIVWAGHGPDEANELMRTLSKLLRDSDVVLTSGGVSMGDLDLVKPLLSELADVHFRRLFMKPGKPFNFATKDDTLIFSLPGNPVSAIVGFEVFVRPAIQTMLGAKTIDRPRIKVRVNHPVRPADRIEFQRAVVSITDVGMFEAVTTGSQASSRLASLLGANAFLVVPPGAGVLPAGTEFEAMLVGPLTGES